MMPAEGRENPLLKKGIFDAFFREKYLTKNTLGTGGGTVSAHPAMITCAATVLTVSMESFRWDMITNMSTLTLDTT